VDWVPLFYPLYICFLLRGRTIRLWLPTPYAEKIQYRAKIIRLSITLAATSAALAALLIVTLFVTALLQTQQGFLIGLLFVACMASLFASLVAFICDINLSLHALKLELAGIAPDMK